MVKFADGYQTRWRAKLDTGLVYYSQVGQPWVQVGTDLYPTPLADATGISITFDANARPIFATQRGATAEIRRYSGGTPVTYAFSGSSPKLWFNGPLQPSGSLWDAVCYYAKDGNLMSRIQRETFAIEHVLYTGGLTSLTNVDVGTDLNSRYQYISATGSANIMLRSVQYPVWPFPPDAIPHEIESVYANVTINSDISYESVIASASMSELSMYVGATINSDVSYEASVISGSMSEDPMSASATINSDISYLLAIIPGDSQVDSMQSNAAINSDIDYYSSVIAGGNVVESASVSAIINSDIDYSV